MDTLQNMYWMENKSTHDISKELGIPQTSIVNLMKKQGIPRRKYREASKEKRLIKVNLSWTPNLAYIVSVLLTDGYIFSSPKQINGKEVRLSVVDEQFADSFKSALQSIGLHPSKHLIKKRNGWNDQFYIRASSCILYDWFSSLSEEEIRKLAFAFPYDFLRGAFDSEGSFVSYWQQMKGIKKLQLLSQVKISNTNEWFINLCRDLGAYLSFYFFKWRGKGKRENRKDVYVIGLSKRREVLHFFTMIKPSIPRKSIQKYSDVIAEAKNNPERYAKIREIREE